jgi:V8-like Glu-specific endopeptidase
MKKTLIWIFCVSFSICVPAAIYGPDDRRDIDQALEYRQFAKAIGSMVGSNLVNDNKDGTFSVDLVKPISKNGFCSDERFAEQSSLGRCSGFLIAPDILVTAGHCGANTGIDGQTQGYCDAFSWIFDYNTANTQVMDTNKIPAKYIYKCQKALRSELFENYPYDPRRDGDFNDFAVFQLERSVEGAVPLKISKKVLALGDSVYTIGYPWGLPAKFSGVSTIRSVSGKSSVFASLDTWSGNSGGPVFNNKNEVVGILVGGHQFDSYTQIGQTCERPNLCDKDGLNCIRKSELNPLSEIQKIDVIRPWIPATL